MCGSAVFTTAMSSIKTAVARHTTARVPCLTFMVRLLVRPRAGFMSGRRIGGGRCSRVARLLRSRLLAQQLCEPLAGDLGLRDEAAGAAALDALVEVRAVAARRQHDGGCIVGRGEAGCDLEPVAAGHVHVEEHELRMEIPRR